MFRFNITKRVPPITFPITSSHMHTDEYATPTPTAVLPQSFGRDFNLIRAVEEYGPQRVASIRQELAQMVKRQAVLTEEMQTLEKLIAVTKPSRVATADGFITVAEEFQQLPEAREILRPDNVPTGFGNGFQMD
jgi:acyl carrier protein phosphodiesterase